MSKLNLNTKLATINLSDSQRSLLSAAALREDGCLTRPASLRGAQISKLAEGLIAAGFAREAKAKASTPIWRQDGKTGAAFALKLTAAGAKVIAVKAAIVASAANQNDAARKSEAAAMGRGATRSTQRETAPTVARGKRGSSKTSPPLADANATSLRATKQSAPRANSKIAAVIALLSRGEGATLAELIAATDWLPHTTRAALTGLRRRGYSLTLDRTDRQRGSVYQITSQPDRDALKPTERAAEAA